MERGSFPLFSLSAGNYSKKKHRRWLRQREVIFVRIGNGYDVHRLVPERPLILGGVKIPYEKGLLGHSDADVLIHAVIDALIGAIGAGDIGRHFPDGEEAYRDIDSTVLLGETAVLLKKAGYRVINIDSVVVAQRPKLAPYIEAMRKRIAEVLLVDPDCVNIKAKTEEGLGFTGSGEGISAQAVCLIEKILPGEKISKIVEKNA